MTGYVVRYDIKSLIPIINVELTGFDTLPKYTGLLVTKTGLSEGDKVVLNWSGYEKYFTIKGIVNDGNYSRVFLEDITGFHNNAYIKYNKYFTQGSSIIDAIVYFIEQNVDVDATGGNFGMPIVFRRSQSRAEAIYSVCYDMCWDLDYYNGSFYLRNIPTKIMYQINVDAWTINRRTTSINNMATVVGTIGNVDFSYTAYFDDHIAEFGELPLSDYRCIAISHKDDVIKMANFLLESQCYEYTYEFKVPVQNIRLNDVIALKNTVTDEVKEIRVRNISIRNNFMNVVGYERNNR